MLFEWTFRAGDMLTFIGGVVVAAAFLYRRGASDTELKVAVTACLKEISEMKAEIAEFRRAMTKLAVQDERLNAISSRLNTLDNRYDEIRRGEGFITGHRTRVDGEYP